MKNMCLIKSIFFLLALSSFAVDSYQEKLNDTISQGYFSQIGMRDPIWKELTPLITQEVLDDAYAFLPKIKELFIDLNLLPRSNKTMKRIEIKKLGTQVDISFKVNSDFCAFRIPSEPKSIKDVVEKIQEITMKNNGFSFIRNSIEENGKVNDIVQFVFVYIPKFKYIIEFQVGHFFAFYTFTQDSLIRDLKNEGKPITDCIDLWSHPEGTNWTDCFYIKMRNKILNPDDLDMGFDNKFIHHKDLLATWSSVCRNDHRVSIFKNGEILLTIRMENFCESIDDVEFISDDIIKINWKHFQEGSNQTFYSISTFGKWDITKNI